MVVPDSGAELRRRKAAFADLMAFRATEGAGAKGPEGKKPPGVKLLSQKGSARSMACPGVLRRVDTNVDSVSTAPGKRHSKERSRAKGPRSIVEK